MTDNIRVNDDYHTEMSRACDNPPHALLFDMDNTLFNFIGARRAACQAATKLTEQGKGDDLFNYFLRKVHGFEDHEHISDYLRDCGEYDRDLAAQMGEIFDATVLSSLRLYPGVLETLSVLRRHSLPMAIVTDADSTHAFQRMHQMQLQEYFQTVITPDVSGERKPNHRSFLLATERLSVSPKNTWIIGDSLRREMVPGNELGMTTVYARYGDWLQDQKTETVSPDYVLDNFPDLLACLGLEHP